MDRLQNALFGVPFRRLFSLVPGTALAVVLGLASMKLSQLLGVRIMGFEKSPFSTVMVALIVGLIIRNLLPIPSLMQPGITFVVKKVLRLGIILLGIRLSIGEVLRLGVLGLPIVVGCITGAVALTTLLNRMMKLPERLGTLIAVGTSICGVSAIVAAGPAINARDEEVAYAVSVITVFGIIATLAYPACAHLIFNGDPVRAGLFLGTAIHDTSQVTGAGLVYSQFFDQPEALNVATVAKLVRNIFMGLVIPVLAMRYSTKSSSRGRFNPRKLIPLFVFGFIFCAGLRSAGDLSLRASGRAFVLLDEEIWTFVCGTVKTWAVALLVFALAGVGLNTRFGQVRKLGLKPFAVGLGAALGVGVISFGLITLLGAFVSV